MATVGNIVRLADINDDNNILSKVRYQIIATNWSNSTDTSGYYTYTLTLNPTLTLNYSPNIWIAGATDNTLATDTEKAQYDLLNEQCNLTSESTLVLYAKTKPTSNFYIWVESKASGSSEELQKYITTGLIYSNCSYVAGGYSLLGKLVIVNIRVKCTDTSTGRMDIHGFPEYDGLISLKNVVVPVVANMTEEITSDIDYCELNRVGSCVIKGTFVQDKEYAINAVYICE